MSEPTIFEHVGGADALRRLADAQYRRCLADPALIQVFGTQGRPGHVEHLAAWLGEVFGWALFLHARIGRTWSGAAPSRESFDHRSAAPAFRGGLSPSGRRGGAPER